LKISEYRSFFPYDGLTGNGATTIFLARYRGRVKRSFLGEAAPGGRRAAVRVGARIVVFDDLRGAGEEMAGGGCVFQATRSPS